MTIDPGPDVHLQAPAHGRVPRQRSGEGPFALTSRRRRAGRRRNLPSLRRVVLLCLGLFVLALGWVGWTGWKARSELLLVQRTGSQLSTMMQGVDAEGISVTVADLGRHTRRAHQLTSGPVWYLAAHIPVVGGSATTVRGLAAAADETARGPAVTVASIAGQLQPAALQRSDGSLDVARFEPLVPDLTSAHQRLAAVTAHVRELPTSFVPSPVTEARGSLLSMLERLTDDTGTAEQLARVAPDMLGGHEPRRYFLALQNDAEARGTGGFLGTYAILDVRDGRTHLVHAGSDRELPPQDASALDLGADWSSRWASFGSGRDYRAANYTPHFPWVAATWAALYRAQSGTDVDGVVGIDSVVLGDLLAASGPVVLPDGTRIDAASATSFLLSGAYQRYPDPEVRKQMLVDLVKQLGHRLENGQLSLPTLLDGLRTSADHRRLMVWSSHPQIEQVLQDSAAGGALPNLPGPFAAAVVQNASGTKLDYYLDRSLIYSAPDCGRAGMRDATVTVGLHNGAPASGLPSYVTTRLDPGGAGKPAGSHRVYLSVYLSIGAQFRGATLDGVPVSMEAGSERGRPVVSAFVDLPVGSTRSLVVQTTEPSAGEPSTPDLQPLVRDQRVVDAARRCGG